MAAAVSPTFLPCSLARGANLRSSSAFTSSRFHLRIRFQRAASAKVLQSGCERAALPNGNQEPKRGVIRAKVIR